MDLGFRGEVVDFYHRYRRGYPPAVVDSVMAAFGLTAGDVVLDLGCGTGQLTLPMAARLRAVVGMDPEPEMLSRAWLAASERGIANVGWLLGADTDVAVLGPLLGQRALGAVTIGQALHWMDVDALFRTLVPLLRPGGGVAVVTNGTPIWLQDTAWSRALRHCLEEWLGRKVTLTCGTDETSQRRYRESLAAAGFEVGETIVEYADEMDLEFLVGAVYSTFPVDRLPAPDQRAVFAERIRQALHPQVRFPEQTRVRVLFGRRSGD